MEKCLRALHNDQQLLLPLIVSLVDVKSVILVAKANL
jgi:hypothetical protein